MIADKDIQGVNEKFAKKKISGYQLGSKVIFNLKKGQAWCCICCPEEDDGIWPQQKEKKSF